jgi:enediyne biosynthesis protein E5
MLPFLQQIKKHPKLQLIILLSLFYCVSLFHVSLSLAFFLLVTCVTFTVVADLVFTYIRRKTVFVPYAAIITGIILALIIDTSASWLQILVIATAAMGIKNFFRIGGRHLLNPAASGLLTGWVVFGLQPSWWAATFYTPGAITLPNVFVLVSLLAMALVSAYRLKRYNTVLSFLLVFTLLYLLITQFSLQAGLRILLSPGNLFYAFVMVAEPMTSPVNRKRQLLYGSFVAVCNIVFVFLIQNTVVLQNFPDASLVALLIGNILFFKFR